MAIGVTDIGNIIYRDCKSFGLETYQKGNVPKGELKKERIVIIPKAQVPLKYWNESFVEVNICTPNIKNGMANLVRLQELEHQARQLLDSSVGEYNSCKYRYKIESIGIEEDTELCCHYVNVTLNFETLNIK